MSNNKIDIVVSWLDDTDASWQKEFQYYKNLENKEINAKSANNDARFRDYDTFKYWFRAIEKNATWVNRIYLVTCGHLPKWLNVQHPKLTVVKHSDFIPEAYLPTFSSDTIALNLHRIKGLSENFVYFNDDMFLINTTKSTDFFKNNIPRDMLTLIPATTSEQFNHFTINNMSLIHQEFSKKDIVKKNFFKMIHFKTGIRYLGTTLLQLPYPNISDIMHFHLSTAMNKSIYEKLWAKHFETFDKTCKHKFREISDVTDWYIRLYSLAIGNFEPARMHKFGRFLSIKQVTSFESLFQSKYKELCLNDDTDLTDEAFGTIIERMKKAFENKFPGQSSFEI